MSSSLNVNATAFVPSVVAESPGCRRSERNNGRKESRRNRHHDNKARRQKNLPNRGEQRRRPKRKPRKNTANDRPKATAEEHEPNDEIDAVAFPMLTATNADNVAVSSTMGWSRAALQGQVAEEERTERAEKERSDMDRAVNLMPLRPKHNAQASVSNEVEKEVTSINLGAATNSEAPSPAPQLPKTTSKLDIGRMRDRWWELMKEKRARDAVEAERRQHEALCDDTASEVSSYHEDSTETQFDDREEDYDEELLLAYQESPFPLHRAVIDDDGEAIRRIMRRSFTTSDDSVFQTAFRKQLGVTISTKLLSEYAFTPIHLAVYLDRPHLLTLLQSDVKLVKMAESSTATPLMLAAELAVDSCIRPLLSRGGASALMTRDKLREETAIHYACRTGVPSSTLKILLSWLGGSGQMQKPLSYRNSTGQTPLHLACLGHHTHLVETFLQICRPSLLSRLLQMQDQQHQTPLFAALASEASEVVMALLMWRGNQQVGRSALPSRGHCPLEFTVSSGSIEMLHILLEFSDTDGYNLDTALLAAVRSTSTESRQEIVRILVHNGANPCFGYASVGSPSTSTAFSIAATKGDTAVLGLLIDTYQQQLEERQFSRRHDPLLRKQPETYFAGAEKGEELEMWRALNDALVRSLFLGWSGNLACLEASILLFRKGCALRDSGYVRVKRSIVDGKLKTVDEVDPGSEIYVYESNYIHYGAPDGKSFKIGAYDRSALKFWSEVMLRLPWMQDEERIQCSWILGERKFDKGGPPPASLNLETIVLVARGGQEFVAHSWIVARRSGKLAAAIRFAIMNRDDADVTVLRLDVDVAPKMCVWLLQHIYHGSIAGAWGPDGCEEIFELSLVAQEFLCQTLVVECEMRLVGSNMVQCCCWSCCLAVKKIGRNSAKCLYRVRGPSEALTASTAIDSLAVSQQLTGDTEEYRIKFWSRPKYPVSSDASFRNAWTSYDSNLQMMSLPFLATRDSAVAAILLSFNEVVRSDSFLDQSSSMIQDSNTPIVEREKEAQVMLLQMCLDELEASVMSRLENGARAVSCADSDVATKAHNI